MVKLRLTLTLLMVTALASAQAPGPTAPPPPPLSSYQPTAEEYRQLQNLQHNWARADVAVSETQSELDNLKSESLRPSLTQQLTQVKKGRDGDYQALLTQCSNIAKLHHWGSDIQCDPKTLEFRHQDVFPNH